MSEHPDDTRTRMMLVAARSIAPDRVEQIAALMSAAMTLLHSELGGDFTPERAGMIASSLAAIDLARRGALVRQ